MRSEIKRPVLPRLPLYVLKNALPIFLPLLNISSVKLKNVSLYRPRVKALYFEEALHQIVVLVQKCVYGKFIDRMREKTPEALDDITKRCSVDASQQEKEIRALKRYRPCKDKKDALRVEGRLDRSPDISFEASTHSYCHQGIV